jgi:hypothetical protein
MDIDFVGILKPFIEQLLVVVVSAVGVVLIALLNKAKEYIVGQIGATTYNRAREVAIGLYTLLEDEFKDVEKAGAEKKAKMDALLLAQFPKLTQTELDAINKEVWKTINDYAIEIGLADETQ